MYFSHFLQKIVFCEAKDSLSEGERLSLVRPGSPPSEHGAQRARAGCGGRVRASRSRATGSGYRPDGTSPSSCVLISSAAASARTAHISSSLLPYHFDQGDRSLISYFERGREFGVRATSVFSCAINPLKILPYFTPIRDK